MIFCDLLKSVSTTWPMLLKVLRAAGYISSAGGSSKTSRQPAPWSSVPANFLSKIICSHKHCVCNKQCRHVKRDKTGMSRADVKGRSHDQTPYYMRTHRLLGLMGSRFCGNARAHVGSRGEQTEYGNQQSEKVLPEPDCTYSAGQSRQTPSEKHA